MDQHELDSAVARATGESIETIEAMGFSVMTFPPPLVIVDRRTRLRDLTRKRLSRRKAPRPASSGNGLPRRRAAACIPDGTEQILPIPRITKLTFDNWGA